jgi:acyl-CoA synthetase (NDP forming)
MEGMLSEQILKQAEQENRTQLTEVESKEFLQEAGIPVIETKLTRTKKTAISTSKKMGFPVVLKVASPDIIHKSDSGGVKLRLANATQVGNAYSEIMLSIRQRFPEARIQGVSLQKMARPGGVEVIIGLSKDAQFGPVLMFGLGGILVEVLKDVSFRLVPITKRDAEEMVREIKGNPLLQGYRGQEPADIPFLEQLLVKVSELAEQYPQIKELDLNPIFAYQDGAIAVDARVVLEAPAEG